MVIKIRQKVRGGNKILYKGEKMVITVKDVEDAEKLDLELKKLLNHTEKELIKRHLLSKEGAKKDVLAVWFEVGKMLNIFLKKYQINPNEKHYFWKDLYEHNTLLHKSIHKKEINESRNDYKIAYILANKYTLDELKKAGPWAILREVFYSKNIVKDRRIINWIFKELIERPRTRNEARPFLKSVADRFKQINTKLLSDEELLVKLKSTLPAGEPPMSAISERKNK